MFAGLAAGVWVRRFSLHSFPIISMISHPVLYIGVSSFLFQPFSSLNGFGKSNWIFGETMRKNWYKLFSQRHCLILWLFVVHLRLFGLSACCCVAFQGEPAFARHNSKQVWFCPRLLAAFHSPHPRSVAKIRPSASCMIAATTSICFILESLSIPPSCSTRRLSFVSCHKDTLFFSN